MGRNDADWVSVLANTQAILTLLHLFGGTCKTSKFREIFAADVERTAARVMAATQKPIFGQVFGQASDAAAWKSIPSWYLLTTEDQVINPDLERLYAKRMGATTVEIASSHAVFVSHPHAVVKLIEQAAKAVW
jgi:pimeloyl-ACP methyl ester carboxylesterase